MSNLDSKSPLVTAKVITYNSSKYVLETLESIKAQTYQNIELVISDDCSTDNTIDICAKWVAENKNRFVRCEIVTSPVNTGIPANCNRAVKAARGEWIKVVAGDDALEPDCIEVYVTESAKPENKDIYLFFSDITLYANKLHQENIIEKTNTSKLEIAKKNVSAREQFEILLRANKVWAGSLFVKRELYDIIGLYDETLRYWEDRPFLLKATLAGYLVKYVDFFSCKYRKSSSSVQRKKERRLYLTDFTYEKNTYFLNNYARYLSNSERYCLTIIHIINSFFRKEYSNKVSLKMATALAYFLKYPFKALLQQQKKKYL